MPPGDADVQFAAGPWTSLDDVPPELLRDRNSDPYPFGLAAVPDQKQ
ncbi:hypothetical protein [Catellatospora sp. NPDC049133]|jgi:hypothetical protein